MPDQPLPPDPPPRPAKRFHDLDALRSFAMMLGILLHATLFVLPDPNPADDVFWPVQHTYATDTEIAANPYSYVLLSIHGFRMPVFFVLSGFFTAMLWRRRGLRALAVHRLKRIALPLAVGMFTVVPVVALFFPDSDFQAWGGRMTAWTGTLYHLWFLLYLLLMGVGFWALVRLGARFRSRFWWLLAPLVLVPQYLMRETFGADTPVGVLPAPDIFSYYFVFFLFGAFFHERGIEVRRWWTVGLVPALVVFLPGIALVYPTAFEALNAHVDAAWFQVASALLQTSFAWFACFGMMGLFRWAAGRERFWVRYMSDASYWIYLWHLPLVILGQQLATEWGMGAHAAYVFICMGAVAVLLVTYQLGVRYTFVGNALNGPRQRRSDRKR